MGEFKLLESNYYENGHLRSISSNSFENIYTDKKFLMEIKKRFVKNENFEIGKVLNK